MTMSYVDTHMEKRWTAKVEVSPVQGVEAGVTHLTFTFTDVPQSDDTGLTKGAQVSGLLQEKDGYSGPFKSLYLAIGKPSSQALTFDDSMVQGLSFVLVGCSGKPCNFHEPTFDVLI